MFGNAYEDIGEPGFRIDIVELGGADEVLHDRGALTAAIRAAEQPRLGPKVTHHSASSAALSNQRLVGGSLGTGVCQLRLGCCGALGHGNY